MAKVPDILPHARVFPIQIGSELFKLSGASICSDGETAPLVQMVQMVPMLVQMLVPLGPAGPP